MCYETVSTQLCMGLGPLINQSLHICGWENGLAKSGLWPEIVIYPFSKHDSGLKLINTTGWIEYCASVMISHSVQSLGL